MGRGSSARGAGNEASHLRLAINEARRSRHEPDGRIHPFVGVVVVRDDQVVASASRGDRDPGDHAEFCVLEKKAKADVLAGCTVYCTLEPCTTRNHPKVPCAERLIERKVAKVVVGMLDPDQRITGKGILRLRRAGIAVELFPPELMAEIEELNRDFTRDREAQALKAIIPGVAEAGLTAFYPSRDYYNRFRHTASTIDRYVSTAERTVVLVSVNLMTGIPFHDLCVAIERKLASTTWSAEISLLDPRRSDLMAAIAPALSDSAEELSRNIRKRLDELVRFRNALSKNKRARVSLRVHGAIPFGSAILLDHRDVTGRIQIETKPYRAGLQKSLAFEVMRIEPDGLYDVLADSYEKLLADGEPVEGTETWLRG